MTGRYILIGGTGFFGGALARELRARGLAVVTLARGWVAVSAKPRRAAREAYRRQ